MPDFIAIEEFAKQNHNADYTGHDWWHIWRVRNLALKIAEKEGGNKDTIHIAALLHDICDHKRCNNPESCYDKVKSFLQQIEIDDSTIKTVIYIIQNISFKKPKDSNAILNIEGQIVQDADRLDAIGAIGISRVFSFGGKNNRDIYDPSLIPLSVNTIKSHHQGQNTSINHFYEKLLRLKDLMNTVTAKQIAVERHQYLEQFLFRFYKEWNGEDF